MFEFPDDLIAFCKQRRQHYSNQSKSFQHGGLQMGHGAKYTTKEYIKLCEEAIAHLDAIIKQFSEAK